MNITNLTYNYDIYYDDKKLDNILDMEYNVIASTISGNHYVEISISYINSYGNMQHIRTNSNHIKFVKRNTFIMKDEE